MIRKILSCLLAVSMLLGCALAEVVPIQGTVSVTSVAETPAVTPAPTATAISATDATATAASTAEPTATPEPTQTPRLYGLRIGIDPGHQEHANSEKEPVAPNSSETKAKVSSGTAGVSTGVAEYITDLEVALKLREALEAQGCEVYMTREVNDIDISNLERAEMMNELGVDLVLRLHCDGATDKSANGIGMFVRATGEKQEESEAAATVLLVAMREATGATARGYRTAPYPAPWLLRAMRERGARITLSADAHSTDGICAHFSQVKRLAKACGYQTTAEFRNGRFVDVPL